MHYARCNELGSHLACTWLFNQEFQVIPVLINGLFNETDEFSVWQKAGRLNRHAIDDERNTVRRKKTWRHQALWAGIGLKRLLQAESDSRWQQK